MNTTTSLQCFVCVFRDPVGQKIGGIVDGVKLHRSKAVLCWPYALHWSIIIIVPESSLLLIIGAILLMFMFSTDKINIFPLPYSISTNSYYPTFFCDYISTDKTNSHQFPQYYSFNIHYNTKNLRIICNVYTKSFSTNHTKTSDVCRSIDNPTSKCSSPFIQFVEKNLSSGFLNLKKSKRNVK